jgi:hypothetical protein
MAGSSVTPPCERPRSLSPILRRSRHNGRKVVIEHVVEKANASIVYPILTRTNYLEWALVMRVNLQAADLWDAINKGSGDYCDDWNALAALLWAVPPEMQAWLVVKEMVKEAWEAIHSYNVREVNTEKFQWEFDNITFKSSECVQEFAMRISSLANQLRLLGDEIPDKKVMKKMLESVPDHLEQVSSSMETLHDLDVVSIEEAGGHLHVVENRRKKLTVPA